jgi:hypothetical protein
LGAADEIFFHDGRVFGFSDVGGKVLGDLSLSSEEGGTGSGDPGWEESSEVWSYTVDGLGIVICLYVDLGIWGKFFIGFVVILVAFDMEDVNLDRRGGDESSNGLDDVAVAQG